MKAMVDQTVKWFGRIDCLVNNAAIPAPMVSITEIDVATIDQLMAVNVRGVLLGIKHVAPVMLAQDTGSIINIGSMAGLRGGVSGHIYSATKGAVLALTQSAGAELGEKGIRVNGISPGAIVTGIFAKAAGRRRRQGGPVDGCHQGGIRLVAANSPAPDCRTISRERRSIWRATDQASSMATTSWSMAAIRA